MNQSNAPEKEWTVVSLLKTSADFLKQKGIDDARLSAELLLAEVLGLQRMELYLNFEQPISPKELEQFRGLVRRRLAGEPVQYILGWEEFFGLRFEVNPAVLIPRPETELLVESVLDDCDGATLSILDIGTGSGAIAVALAKSLPAVRIVAVDISVPALEVAQRNAARHGVESQIQFLVCDALQPDFAVQFPERFDVIVSNPPYVPLAEKENLQKEVRDFEPAIALFCPTGFEFYEKIATDALTLLKPKGKLYLELHADAAEKVGDVLKQKGFQNILFRKDYQGFRRIAVAELPPAER
ncbi:MAG: peptide chain release factor N(5)-glutamine methyltransferase [Chloroherpetonaceae bacterium]|nr:peptide chain release factor N(5)-glutamine methyltransferase [Chloroherpetonaceae bacterium]MDW8019809.1 peptide chain release factor N(5)-glutamine methyltransferase [Chloroherpetonaceae bacterium]